MFVYRCQHCYAELGEVVPDDPVPRCVDHPDGAVEVVDNADPQPD